MLLGNVAGFEQPLLSDLKTNPVILFAVVTDAQKKVIVASTIDGDLPKSVVDDLFDGETKGRQKSLDGKGHMDVDVP